MKLVDSYRHHWERERGNKTHIFKQEVEYGKYYKLSGNLTLCKKHPKGSLPYDGDISQVTCWECKAIYLGEMKR